ncbi:VOC family protein [Mycolicibacterium arenosum]|uniref:VOC family protein n=1 Tax=Mycolicibacterium arenosum TaxID=2952157 RepID=A0ABT1LZ51_9MYCO|nr:VOC family protein [Mycolicibacterium sp. CAU 1645]MCP9271605.1 VOC family protein [Mycolicibacterium sp. CAU 1645]
MTDLTPPTPPFVAAHLVVDDAAAAIDFYAAAFGAEEMIRLAGPDGRIAHASLLVNGAMIMLNDDYPEMSGGKSTTPTALGGSAVTIHLQFADDVESRFQRALDAGATVVAPLEDQFWGDRYGAIRDPFGHLWSLAQHVREVDMAELAGQMSQGS